jgi:hypothetical protein
MYNICVLTVRIQHISFYILLTSTLEAGGRSAPRPGRFTPGKEPIPIVQEAWWAPGLVWTCAKNLAPTGIRSRTVASLYNDWATPNYIYKGKDRLSIDTEAMKAYCIIAPEWVPSFISRGAAYQADMNALC